MHQRCEVVKSARQRALANDVTRMGPGSSVFFSFSFSRYLNYNLCTLLRYAADSHTHTHAMHNRFCVSHRCHTNSRHILDVQ